MKLFLFTLCTLILAGCSTPQEYFKRGPYPPASPSPLSSPVTNTTTSPQVEDDKNISKSEKAKKILSFNSKCNRGNNRERT
ncbi:MAG: hypothetical protein WCJ84_04105, partial [Candidatus Peregrinibacteria bacterium]